MLCIFNTLTVLRLLNNLVGEERENPMDHSAITSVSSSLLENETQVCSPPLRKNMSKIHSVALLI